MSIDYDASLGALCRHLRSRDGMSQTALADRLNLSQSALSDKELGNSSWTVALLVEVGEIFRASPCDLLRAATLNAPVPKLVVHVTPEALEVLNGK